MTRDDYVRQVQRWTPDTLCIVLDRAQVAIEDSAAPMLQICQAVEFLNTNGLWSNLDYVIAVDADEHLLALLSSRAIRPAPQPQEP